MSEPQQPTTPIDAPVQRRLCILVADDHEMVRVAMRVALDGLAPAIDWHDAADAEEVEHALRTQRDLDLALLDLHMPGADGVDWVARLRSAFPATPLVIVSAWEDAPLVSALLQLGVAGYIPKTDPPRVIRQAVELVLAGGSYVAPHLLSGRTHHRARMQPPAPRHEADAPTRGALQKLTPRQADVMRLLARGQPNKLIARQLGMSEATVKVHLLAIYRALGVRNRTEAVIAAQRVDGIDS